MWPDRRLLDLFKIKHPIVLAPMAGAMDTNLAIAVAQAGGLGTFTTKSALNGQTARARVCRLLD
jgi:nitronate monooxygenase